MELLQQWRGVEREPGKYGSEYAALAHQAYPAPDTAVVLSLQPIDTNSHRVSKLLHSFAWIRPSTTAADRNAHLATDSPRPMLAPLVRRIPKPGTLGTQSLPLRIAKLE
ncbi:hypothetical protein TBK1r_49010 [Stieleria magnilauensis]|uniref:Uncharacterized protein n=1 Tax=Stieleria magnilauensis TaxID=2527963 RepID=A0ABX5Y1D4_9BACT|nr:hypothetical protein TBK1r_49010 [Planctomycetes bacterium TBK1r]